jgi:hypothetical protein
MRIKVFALISLGAGLVMGCGQQSASDNADANTIVQQDDGTLSLKMESAALYNDMVNPSSNTAEWNVQVSKPGRFKVWLSSATRDTTSLDYDNPVKINLLDNELNVTPACDRVVLSSGDVSYPYFRADSYAGSLFISEPGKYNIQVISEKVLPKEATAQLSTDATRLVSVILTPMTR